MAKGPFRTHVISVKTQEGKVESFTVKSDNAHLSNNILVTLKSFYQYDKVLPQVIGIQCFDADLLGL